MTAHEVISSPPHPRSRRSAGPSGNRRPRRRLSSDAVCHIDRVSGGLRLTLRHDRPDGANVVVFSYAGELVRPAHVDVSGSVDLRVPTPHGRYTSWWSVRTGSAASIADRSAGPWAHR